MVENTPVSEIGDTGRRKYLGKIMGVGGHEDSKNLYEVKNGNGTNGSRAHYISHGALPARKKVKSVAMALKGKMARPDSMGVEVSPENLIPLEDESFANF